MPPPKQKPVAATFFPGRRRRSSVTPAFMSATNRDGGAAPSGHRFELVGERPRTALLRQQVDRQRRVSAPREAPCHGTDRIVEPAVLVDHQHAPTRPSRRRPCTQQSSLPWPTKRDLAGLGRRYLVTRHTTIGRRSGAGWNTHRRFRPIHYGSREQGRGRARHPTRAIPTGAAPRDGKRAHRHGLRRSLPLGSAGSPSRLDPSSDSRRPIVLPEGTT